MDGGQTPKQSNDPVGRGSRAPRVDQATRPKRRFSLALMLGLLVVAAFVAGLIIWRAILPPVELASQREVSATAGADAASPGKTSEPSQQPSPAGPKVGGNAGAMSSGGPEFEIRNTLQGWVAALRDRDLDRHLSYYGDQLHTYYLERNVSRRRVARDKMRGTASYSSLDASVSKIEVELDPSGQMAIATFDKRWNFQGPKPSSGVVRERVWLQEVNGKWRIVGERDLKVLQ